MFGGYGPITKIRIKERDPTMDIYREQRDGCYAFVSYESHGAAVTAQAQGSQRYPHLEVKFGGRREFCLDQYADQGEKQLRQVLGTTACQRFAEPIDAHAILLIKFTVMCLIETF